MLWSPCIDSVDIQSTAVWENPSSFESIFSFYHQDASVNSVAVEVNENTEVQNGKGSTFVVTVVNDSIQGMHEWTEEETNLLKQAVEA